MRVLTKFKIYPIIILLFIFLLSLAILSYLYHYYLDSFLGYIFLLLIIIICFFLLIIGIIMYKKNHGLFIIVLAVVLVINGFLGMRLSDNISLNEISKTEEQAQVLISALESYYLENKTYPNSLSELTKKQISIIPRTYTHIFNSREYDYYTYENNENYVISFYSSINSVRVYDSANKEWELSPRGMP